MTNTTKTCVDCTHYLSGDCLAPIPAWLRSKKLDEWEAEKEYRVGSGLNADDCFAFTSRLGEAEKEMALLRDWFAGMALQVMLGHEGGFSLYGISQIAERSYELADAMMKERDK